MLLDHMYAFAVIATSRVGIQSHHLARAQTHTRTHNQTHANTNAQTDQTEHCLQPATLVALTTNTSESMVQTEHRAIACVHEKLNRSSTSCTSGCAFRNVKQVQIRCDSGREDWLMRDLELILELIFSLAMLEMKLGLKIPEQRKCHESASKKNKKKTLVGSKMQRAQ
jgi:hypothetical protein